MKRRLFAAQRYSSLTRLLRARRPDDFEHNRGIHMNASLQKYATPLTTGLFIVSLVSGFALFFHVGSSYFHGMHEWLSIVLVLPFILHVWKNWRSFVSYFKHPPMAIALGLSLAAGLAFAVPAMTASEGGGRGGNPAFAAAQALEASTVAQAAPIFGHDAASLSAALTAAGYKVASPDQPLNKVAEASGQDGQAIISALVAARK
jgi:hypothetical protein